MTLPKTRVVPAMVKDWMLSDRVGLTEPVVLMIDGRPAGQVEVDGVITTNELDPSVVKGLANGHVEKIYIDGRLTAVAVRQPRRKR